MNKGSLPIDVALIIMRYLVWDYRSLVTCQLVCKAWNAAIQKEEPLWRRVYLGTLAAEWRTRTFGDYRGGGRMVEATTLRGYVSELRAYMREQREAKKEEDRLRVLEDRGSTGWNPGDAGWRERVVASFKSAALDHKPLYRRLRSGDPLMVMQKEPQPEKNVLFVGSVGAGKSWLVTRLMEGGHAIDPCVQSDSRAVWLYGRNTHTRDNFDYRPSSVPCRIVDTVGSVDMRAWFNLTVKGFPPHLIIYCYSVTDSFSLDDIVTSWYPLMQSHDCISLLVGLKADLKRDISICFDHFCNGQLAQTVAPVSFQSAVDVATKIGAVCCLELSSVDADCPGWTAFLKELAFWTTHTVVASDSDSSQSKRKCILC